MDRRHFICAAASALAASATRAQHSDRVYRLGFLHPGEPAPASDTVLADSFRMPLRELGYVEGRNLVVERRFAEGKFERIPALAQDLVQHKPDVILAIGWIAAQAAKSATSIVPIVFLTNGDAVALGLVTSLAKPGGNMTGVLIAPEGTLAPKKLQLLKEVVPRATRIALLAVDDPGTGTEQQLREIKQAAASLGVELPTGVVKDGDYAAAFATLAAARPAALFVGAHPFFLRDRKIIIDLAAKYRLPAIYEWPMFVKSGGLMSYGANDSETYREVAVYIDRVLKGANPGDIPVWQPSKLYLVINLRTAKTLGLTLPASLLVRADEVIQ